MLHPDRALPLPGAPPERVAALHAGLPAQLAEVFGLTCERLRRQGACMGGHPQALEMPHSFSWTLAAALALEEGFPVPGTAELLRRHYLSFLPTLRVEQMHHAGPAGRLLHSPLAWERMPRWRAALERLLALLPAAQTRSWLGTSDSAALLTACPTLESLFERTYYGGYLPLLYGFPADLARLCVAVDAGAPVEQIVEQHLSAALVHELCHGDRHREALFPPYLDECIASYLGAQALPASVFPESDGPQALYGAPWLVQVGQALARATSAGTAEQPLALFLAHGGARPFCEVLPGDLLAAARRLGWDEYRDRREIHLLSSNYTPEPWLKLCTLAAAEALPPVETLSLERLSAWPWTQVLTPPESPCDTEILDFGLRSMCLRNHLDGGTFRVTRCVPAGPVQIDLPECVIRGTDDGLGRVPRYLFPPATAARLRGRGIAGYTVTITSLPHAGLPAGLLEALREGAGGRQGPGYDLERHLL